MAKEMHRTSVKVPTNLWIKSQQKGIKATAAMKFGFTAMTYLSPDELQELFEILEEKKTREHGYKDRLDKTEPKIEERAPKDQKHILISLYREYKQTLEFPTESIQNIAQQTGLDEKVLSNDLKEFIWGGN